MNLKSKIFGFTAATALSLSIMTGAMAADSSDKIVGTAELQAGICKIDVTQSNTNFGTWKYDGDEYVLNGGSNASTIGATLKAAKPNGTCNVQVSLGQGLGNNGNYISPDHFKVSYAGQGGMLPKSGGHTFNNVAPDSGSGLVLTLEEVPEDFAPGSYSGDIVLVVVNAS